MKKLILATLLSFVSNAYIQAGEASRNLCEHRAHTVLRHVAEIPDMAFIEGLFPNDETYVRYYSELPPVSEDKNTHLCGAAAVSEKEVAIVLTLALCEVAKTDQIENAHKIISLGANPSNLGTGPCVGRAGVLFSRQERLGILTRRYAVPGRNLFFSPLESACAYGQKEMFNFLVMQGARPKIGHDFYQSESRISLFNRAIMENQGEILYLILHHGWVDPNLPIYGTPPLHIAVEYHAPRAASTLLYFGADPFKKFKSKYDQASCMAIEKIGSKLRRSEEDHSKILHQILSSFMWIPQRLEYLCAIQTNRHLKKQVIDRIKAGQSLNLPFFNRLLGINKKTEDLLLQYYKVEIEKEEEEEDTTPPPSPPLLKRKSYQRDKGSSPSIKKKKSCPE